MKTPAWLTAACLLASGSAMAQVVPTAPSATTASGNGDAGPSMAVSASNLGIDATRATPDLPRLGNPFASIASSTEGRSGGLPFTLNADNVQYDIKAGTMTAVGDNPGMPGGQVEVIGTEGHLWADRIVYATGTDKVNADGHVKFVDTENNVLLVDHLELTGQLKNGTAEALRLQVPKLGEIMQARTAEVHGNGGSPTYVLKDVAYSPCKECIGDRKPWTMYADRLTYDPGEGEVRYNNAHMDVYGVPVMYLPYFSHPIGPKVAKSGILPPQFGHSTAHGDEVRIAAYLNSPDENADYTLRERAMSSRGFLTQLERRQETTRTESEIEGSYLNDQKNGKVRSNLKAIGTYTFEPGLRVGVNGEVASDDTYLNEFFERNDPYLASTAYAEWNNRDRYLALSTTHFQDLDPTRSPAKTAQVLPHFEFNQNIALKDGSWLQLDADAENIARDSGVQYRRLVTQANVEKPMVWDDGSKLTLAGRMRADVYNVDGNTTNNGAIVRTLPEATFDWEKPYVSADGTHTIAPRVFGALSFRGGNPPGVPNEDSVAYEIDYANLFKASRFAGLDRVETGPRLVYGLDNRWGDAAATKWRLFVGQGIRKYDDNDLPQSGGAATTVSDWVGYAEANPVDWVGLAQNFRLDNATFEPRRMDTTLRLGWATEHRPSLDMTYSFLDNSTENLTTRFKLPVNAHWELNGATQNDLRNSRTLEAEAGATLLRDCYKISFIARRRGFSNGDLRPSTDYLVNVQLLTLGEDYD